MKAALVKGRTEGRAERPSVSECKVPDVRARGTRTEEQG